MNQEDLCWCVVGDEGVVALLSEGVLALDLVLVHSRLHLHHLVDAPNLLLLHQRLSTGGQLGRGWEGTSVEIILCNL